VLPTRQPVKVLAFKAGTVFPPVVSATFINSASVVFSPGFREAGVHASATRAKYREHHLLPMRGLRELPDLVRTPPGRAAVYAERVAASSSPPKPTNYVFFLASDDDSDLFLSTDSTPANKHIIAQRPPGPTAASGSLGGRQHPDLEASDTFAGSTWPGGNTISLTAGTQYYLEGDHHQGNGGDAFAATFKFSGAPDPATATPPAGQQPPRRQRLQQHLHQAHSLPQKCRSQSRNERDFSVTAVSGLSGRPVGRHCPADFLSVAIGAFWFALVCRHRQRQHQFLHHTVAEFR